ncbi:hypothetical protein CPLU01_10742 [Colletotrichum plurivorum]|uniref:Uncharacterized protein n=1 Tax=Colletotrichum plurivorum TaxID=2175906 RepID=A0A8H6N8V3_9PEZI|nr:hypothetical protein CPLU01_10742 [Colletotrichum plurivorum]
MHLFNGPGRQKSPLLHQPPGLCATRGSSLVGLLAANPPQRQAGSPCSFFGILAFFGASISGETLRSSVFGVAIYTAPHDPGTQSPCFRRIESLVFLQVCSQQVENGHLLQLGPDGIPSGDYWRSGKECLSLIQTEPSRPHPWLAHISIWLESVQHALSNRHHLKDKTLATLLALAGAANGGSLPPGDRRETWGPKNNEVQLVSRLAATARRPTPADGTGSKTPLLALTFDSTACPFAAPKTEQPPLA